MINRMLRAAQLDVSLYEEVEADASLTQEALMVVILVSVAAGIGSFIAGIISQGIGAALLGLILGIVLGVINYFLWAYITYYAGTNLFGGTADVGELRRTIGYAYSPNILGVLVFIPYVGLLIAFVGAVWALVAAVVAVRQALDFDTGKAILTAIIGWIVILIINAVINLVV
jgi:hypothetical protein